MFFFWRAFKSYRARKAADRMERSKAMIALFWANPKKFFEEHFR